MNFGLSTKALESIKLTLKKYPEVHRAQIFGSRAMGNYRENSDIDIVLFGDIPEKMVAKILLELEELPLPYKFDLISFGQISHAGLKEHVLKYGQNL
jgi:predicted nucleotidyltransferase